MTERADRYSRRADLLEETIAAVPADRWDSDSPCEGWAARDVVSHIVETHEMFEGFVGRSLGEIPDAADDPAAAFAAARAIVEGHLRDPVTADEEFTGIAGPTTFAEMCDTFLSFDLVIHRWDIARAAGLDDTIPAEDLRHVSEQARELSERFGDAMRSPTTFGKEVAAREGADDQTQLLAFLGRDA